MVIAISRELEAALQRQAEQRGVTPEELAVSVLQSRLMPKSMREPQDDWERQLRSLSMDCGVSLSNEAVSSEGIYD